MEKEQSSRGEVNKTKIYQLVACLFEWSNKRITHLLQRQIRIDSLRNLSKKLVLVQISGGGQKGSVLLVAKVLLLFRRNTQTYSSGIVYVFLQYMEGTPGLDGVEKNQGRVCLRLRTTDEKDRTAIAEKKLKNRTELVVGESFAVESFSVIRGLVYLLRCSYRFPSLSKALPRPKNCFYINSFYRGNLLNREGIQSK